ncbi:hypothetical protein H7J86_30560 [Mycobacterium hackensackense]|uniref:hypothetical protein n=1 Tax=Mycobacterium hackensackense TaxID=228909 RepID=UPI002265F4F5|nr:hypothetical protein [Mycobacterium hackensackense]MCV7256526.1 hypothetical protein [Mycobacterium hackensackense]
MTRMRGVVGVCALSATLFLNGAAVAVADTGSDGGGTSSQTGTSTGASQTGTGAGSANSTTKTPRPVGGIAGVLQDRVRTTVRDFTGALGVAGGKQPGPKVTIFPKPRSPQQSSESGTAGSTVSPTTPSTAAEPDPTTPDPTAATTPAATDTTPSSSTTSSTTTPTTAASTASTAAALTIPKLKPPPVIPIAESVSGSVHSAANSVKDAVDALPALLAALPKSTDPVGDVLKTVQSVLTSLGNSVTTITEIPSDLTTLLGFPTPTDPVTTTVAGGVRLPAVTAPAAVSPIDLLPALLAPAPADTTVAAPAGPAAPAPTFAGTVSAGLSQDLAPATPVALHGATSAGSMASVLERAVSKLLVPVSIAALAALALPGVGGLLVVSVLGVRIGYRQAKANFVLQASGISRFAGPGPLGVVRSGSFIALHTRTARTRTAAVVPLRSVSTAFDRAA